MPIQSTDAEIKLIECPRDAMQGMHDFVPTKDKVRYINSLLKVGFHTIDCGSFVSPKAIPQMADTAQVLDQLELDESSSKLSVIVANERGANDAVNFEQVDFLGYPFSISENFQQRNTNRSIADSVPLVESIATLCHKHDKSMVIYISMGFGNPYGEEWSVQQVVDWVGVLHELGIRDFSISDTVGISKPDQIKEVFSTLFKSFEAAEFGAHFHTRPELWEEKVLAAHQNGCKRFDGAIKGFGGCPMAEDELVGNMPTERLIEYFGWDTLKLKKAPFEEAFIIANELFL